MNVTVQDVAVFVAKQTYAEAPAKTPENLQEKTGDNNFLREMDKAITSKDVNLQVSLEDTKEKFIQNIEINPLQLFKVIPSNTNLMKLEADKIDVQSNSTAKSEMQVLLDSLLNSSKELSLNNGDNSGLQKDMFSKLIDFIGAELTKIQSSQYGDSNIPKLQKQVIDSDSNGVPTPKDKEEEEHLNEMGVLLNSLANLITNNINTNFVDTNSIDAANTNTNNTSINFNDTTNKTDFVVTNKDFLNNKEKIKFILSKLADVNKSSSVNKIVEEKIQNSQDSKQLFSNFNTIIETINEAQTDIQNTNKEKVTNLLELTKIEAEALKSLETKPMVLKTKEVNSQIIIPNKNPKEEAVSASNKASSDEKLLKDMIGGVEDRSKNIDKIDRVNNFITNINNNFNNNMKSEVTKTQEPEQLAVDKNTLTGDIVKVIKHMNLNNLKELTVKVAPKELGEIVIKLTVDAGNMKAIISAHNKETFNLLTANLGDLTKSINNSDIKIQSVNINVYNDDTTFFNNNGFNQNNSNFQQNSNPNGSKKKSSELDNIENLDSNTKDTILEENNLSILA